MQGIWVRSWTPVVAGCLIAAGILTGCGGASSADSTASTTAGASTSASSSAQSAAPQSSDGSVSLTWQPPTDNTDGTPLADLAGYDIHYGTQSQNYTSSIKVENPGITTYLVENLPPGTYYFAVTAYDSTGQESADSPEVSATVD